MVIEYPSDKFDEENPQPIEGTGVPKRVIRQINLTLPTSSLHVTTTESFKTFFINHGLTKALRKAFESRGWSTDQMQELMTNFKNKYGQTIPLPKIYQDEDSSDDEGLTLGDGTRYGKKTPGGDGGKGSGGKGLLANVAASQQKAAEAIDTLATRVGEMTTDQVSQAATTVVTEVGHV